MDSHLATYIEKGDPLVRAVVCFLVKDNKVILGLRKRVSLGLGANLISGIGGKVGDKPEFQNETDEEGLRREVKEEIGVDILEFEKMGRICFYFMTKPKWNQEVIAYIVTSWKGTPLETESIKPMEFNIHNLPKTQMWDDNTYWVPMLLEGKKFTASFLYGEDNKTVIENIITIINEI
ncbi:MAG: NUDIX domain-containing protein [bacterium]